jgi:phenylacetate-CoA ligase
MEIQIEMSDSLLSDTVSKIEKVRKQIESEVHSLLGISAKVKLVEPNTVPRSEGKAKRVIDNRKI